MAKYKVDVNDPNTYVISKLNGNKYTRITYKHTRKYGLELSEYMEKFNVSSVDLISTQIHRRLGFTKQKAIEMYGKDDGLKKWREYCEKQAYSNSFEYKHKKHNMTEDEYKKFNLSRAITLDNLIKKYGIDNGTNKWNDYCERQAYAGCSLEYFKEKYGEEGEKIYKNICDSKAITISNMISKYGVEDGTMRYNSWLSEIGKNFYSNISQELFEKIRVYFPDNKIYYATYNGEYFLYNLERSYKYDYVDTTLKKCIEFNGDVFHGNPKKYNKFDTPNFYDKTMTCEKIWKLDEEKINLLKRERNIDTLIVWESDYLDNQKNVITQCLEFLKNGNRNL